MSALTGPALVAAALLALAGAQKLVDPTMTVGALRALGLPASAGSVRVGSAAELMLGVTAIVVGGPPLWWLVVASYAVFSVVVVLALRKGTMIGSCGCFGREDTPPHPVHVALNAVLGVAAGSVAVTMSGSPWDQVVDHGWTGAGVVALAAIALFLLHTAYVEVPRTVAGRSTSGR